MDPFLNLRQGKARVSARLVRNFRKPPGASYTISPLGRSFVLLLGGALEDASADAEAASFSLAEHTVAGFELLG
jgi:hypothetical protein